MSAVSKPWIESYEVGGGTRRPKRERRWAVAYRVPDPAGGRPKIKKKRGFEKKGLADTYAANVEKARLRAGGWSFDASWAPVHDDDLALGAAPGPTVIDLVEDYWAMHWHHISPNQRTKIRGRLIVMAALLSNAEGMADALEAQDPRKGKQRSEPTTAPEWAARYLRGPFLPNLATDDGVLDDERLEVASAWIRKMSLPVDQLDDTLLNRLRLSPATGPHSTRRTYESITKAVLGWAVESGRLEKDPSRGMVKIVRDPNEEQVDPERVPGEAEVWEIAAAFTERFGQWLGVLVVLCAFGALRISEAVNLRRQDFEWVETGGVRVTVRKQRRRQVASSADDGTSTTQEAPPKGRGARGPRSRRTFYLASGPAAIIKAHLDTRPGGPQARLFVGPRGAPVDPGTFRKEKWNPLIAELFPAGHRLCGITPHSLRHFGMTMWLRAGLPLPLIQKWGGWSSLKVMLDTYAAVLPDDEDRAIALLEEAS